MRRQSYTTGGLSLPRRESKGFEVVWRFSALIPWSPTGTYIAAGSCYLFVGL